MDLSLKNGSQVCVPDLDAYANVLAGCEAAYGFRGRGTFSVSGLHRLSIFDVIREEGEGSCQGKNPVSLSLYSRDAFGRSRCDALPLFGE